jgi:metal-responsive CopG/Arc/MetJ family transcriptional regulator
MKTAISIPDELFRGAERLARRSKKSRSRVFRDALREYLDRHAADEITERMNSALKEIFKTEPETDPFVRAAARPTLERSEW